MRRATETGLEVGQQKQARSIHAPPGARRCVFLLGKNTHTHMWSIFGMEYRKKWTDDQILICSFSFLFVLLYLKSRTCFFMIIFFHGKSNTLQAVTRGADFFYLWTQSALSLTDSAAVGSQGACLLSRKTWRCCHRSKWSFRMCVFMCLMDINQTNENTEVALFEERMGDLDIQCICRQAIHSCLSVIPQDSQLWDR